MSSLSVVGWSITSQVCSWLLKKKLKSWQINVASLGFDQEGLQKDNIIKIDYVHIDRSKIEETGEYYLVGLFVRLGYAIDKLGAKRVVPDTIENIFAGLSDQRILRTELRRLFQWLRDKGYRHHHGGAG